LDVLKVLVAIELVRLARALSRLLAACRLCRLPRPATPSVENAADQGQLKQRAGLEGVHTGDSPRSRACAASIGLPLGV